MANFDFAPDPPPMTIDKFLGINEAVGQTQIQLGEAVSMKNFRITKNFKAQKRKGTRKFIDYNNSLPTYIWYGNIAGIELLISSNNGKIYEYNMSTEINTEIGTMNTDFINFFEFNGKLYIQNGIDYKSYDGTTFQDVVARIPVLYIETPPAGGGTFYEELNVLTGQFTIEFNGDGSSTAYHMVLDELDSIDSIKIDGSSTTAYSVALSTGIVTFNTAPASDSLVEITATKNSLARADDIKKCKYAMDFGAGNDTNIFMWGNPDKQNTRFRSYIQDPSYFPANNFVNIGTNNTAITDIVAHYSTQVVFKTDRTYISKPDEIQFADGNYDFEYPISDLNEKVGNVAPNQVRLIDNSPVSFHSKSFYKWNSTNVEDERNAKIISDRIKLSLMELDLSQAITFDYEQMSELWVAINNEIYIYNYTNNTFYKFEVEFDSQAYAFLEGNGEVYIGTNGAVAVVDDQLNSDFGEAISAKLELGFTDFGVPHLQKSSRRMWVVIRPEDNTGVKILWQTDRKALTEDKAIEVNFLLSTFANVNYGDFSFATNRNPQPFRKKFRAKKYAYIKFIFVNDNIDETLTMLSLRIQASTGAEVK